MLCAKRKLTGETVTAYLSQKAQGPFTCLDCGDEVILKAGRKAVNHFAHLNPLACQYALNESEEHRRCKVEIYQALLQEPNVTGAMLERPLGTNRPDGKMERGRRRNENKKRVRYATLRSAIGGERRTQK
jgi:competence protein CoiA